MSFPVTTNFSIFGEYIGKMASIKYRIKGTPSNNCTIYARMYNNGIAAEIKTGLSVIAKEWNAKKERVKHTTSSANNFSSKNETLEKLTTFYHDSINNALIEETPINKAYLKSIIDDFFKQPSLLDENNEKIYFIPFIEKFIEESKMRHNLKTNKIISPKTIADYRGTLKKLKHYETEVHSDKLTHLDITIEFHSKFIRYCKEYFAIKDKTIGGEISNIKLFCRRAEEKGIKVSQAYRSNEFYVPNNDTNDFALTEDEVSKIETVDLGSNEKLDNARDWLVIGIWCGLRVGDLLNLSKTNIDDDFIKVTNRKTGIPVVIPIHDSVKSVLEKRKGAFPRKISNQKFNDYIKQVAQKAGINAVVEGLKPLPKKIKGFTSQGSETVHRRELGKYPKHDLISSHCCRRTFATFHYGKLDTLTIMHVTGHRTERQFLEYVKITPTKHAEEMKAMWNKYYKNAT